MKLFGDRSKFAIEIGYLSKGTRDLCHVDVFASNQSLHPVDKTVYIPSFVASMDSDLNRLLSDFDPLKEQFPFPKLTPTENFLELHKEAEHDNSRYLEKRFMDWGPTTDDVSVQIFKAKSIVHIPFMLYDSLDLSCAIISNSELNTILHNSIVELLAHMQN